MPDFRGLTNWADVETVIDWREAGDQLAQRIAAALADLDRIEATHLRTDKAGIEICGECTHQYRFARVVVSWPCLVAETAARIRRHLTGEDATDAAAR